MEGELLELLETNEHIEESKVNLETVSNSRGEEKDSN